MQNCKDRMKTNKHMKKCVHLHGHNKVKYDENWTESSTNCVLTAAFVLTSHIILTIHHVLIYSDNSVEKSFILKARLGNPSYSTGLQSSIKGLYKSAYTFWKRWLVEKFDGRMCKPFLSIYMLITIYHAMPGPRTLHPLLQPSPIQRIPYNR